MQTTHILRVDEKGRISLGSLAEGISSFRVSKDNHNRIILEPIVEISANEKWLHKNKVAFAKVKQGLKDACIEKISSKGSFAKYTNDNDE